MKVLNAIYRLLHKRRIFVNDVLKYINHIASPIILEAGAADGSDTLQFAKQLPSQAVIYAFEPVQQNFEHLKDVVKNRSNVRVFRMALGDHDGKMRMNISRNIEADDNIASSSSLLKPKTLSSSHPQIVFEKQEEVDVRTIDSWAAENKVTRIDAMWLDMQGLECATLQASPVIMKTVQVLYTEVNFEETYEGCILYDEYRDWLYSLGFKLVKSEFRWKEQGNALFVRQ